MSNELPGRWLKCCRPPGDSVLAHAAFSRRVLVVVNKGLPAGDYRLAHAQMTKRAELVTFASPERPSGRGALGYQRLGFGEGLSLNTFVAFAQLLVHLRRHRRRVALVHFYSTVLTLAGPLISRLAGIPSVVTITGFGRVYNSSGRRYRFMRPLYDAMSRLSGLAVRSILFQNHGDMAWFRSRHPQLADKCEYVGSGIVTRTYKRMSYLGDPLVVLHIARLLPSKGIEDFLAVAGASHSLGARFRLIGPPARGAEALLARVKQAHAEGLIEYLGELSSSETRRNLEAAHVLLFTSHGEGMARAMLEAGFAGLCPVAYSIPANRDIVAAGRGFLVPLRDTDGAAEAVARLERDRELLTRNAAAYQRFVSENYGVEAFVDRLDGVLDRALATSAARR